MATVKKAQFGRSVKKTSSENYKVKEVTYPGGATKTKIKFNPKGGANFSTKGTSNTGDSSTNFKELPPVPKEALKSGGKVMLKRKDGSVSKRGLWDNMRANKGSGKKPTAQMLKQEKKIKAKTKK